jgi:fermentation-respiration switch protein FrsA (DUF1100 family)
MTLSRAHPRSSMRRPVIVGALLVAMAATAGFLALSHPGARPRPGHAKPASRTSVVSSAPSTAPSTATTAAPPTASTTSAPTPPPGPPYTVEDQTVVLVDSSRTTPARGSVAAKPGRVLRTIVRRPVGPRGPLPLVVFAHGYNVEPETYEPLLDAWASAGYLVVAPECPGSARDLPGTPVPDYAAQARDISFVITSLLGGLVGPIAPGEITVAGHSDGGTAVTIMALNAAYADTRVKAYINMAGQIPTDVSGPWTTGPPSGVLLVAVGSNDEYGNLALSTAMFDAARMPKALLVVPGGDHLGTFVASTPSAQAVRAATTRFLSLVFAGATRTFAPPQLRNALEGPGGAQPFSVSVAN